MSPQSGFAATLLDHAQDIVTVVDDDGRFAYTNRATARILGFTHEDLVGEDVFGYVHPDDFERVHEAFDAITTATGEVERTVEYRFRAADGSYVWLESLCSNATSDELGGYVVSSRPISDRVEAERERDEMASRLRELANQTADVLWMFDGDWSELLFVNPAYEDVYGGDIGELEADPMTFLDCVHPEDLDAVQAAMERLAAGESVEIEYRVNPDRNYNAWVWVQAEPIVEDGEVVRIVGFSRDVTDRRRRERQLVVIDNVLRHNLRNGLNTIMGRAALIEEETGQDPATHASAIIETSEEILATAEKQRNINELFTTPARRTVVDLDALVGETVETVTDEYESVHVFDRSPTGARVRAIPQLEFALTELLVNAAKHAEVEEPTITIDGAVRADEVVLEITDDCPPIPEAEFRVLTGEAEMDQVYHSTGLGLWLAYWVLDLSDGTIEFTRADSGNRVTVALPAATADPDAREQHED